MYVKSLAHTLTWEHNGFPLSLFSYCITSMFHPVMTLSFTEWIRPDSFTAISPVLSTEQITEEMLSRFCATNEWMGKFSKFVCKFKKESNY